METDEVAPTIVGYYDLSGRKLSSIPAKGVYIVGGKKVIVK